MTDSYSLDPQERNVGTDAPPSSCGSEASPPPVDVAFRHSGWQPQRDKIRAAIARSDAPEGRLRSWDGCGADAWVLRDPENDHRLRIAACTCKDRFCVPCADSRSARIGRRIRDKIGPTQISFLTLTLADNDLDLKALLDKLLRSFRRLRTWSVWKREVVGGVAFVELKWNQKNGRWHPHIHAIMETGYIPQRSLSDRWREITAGSFIVHIKRPENSDTVIRYVTKYGSKPLDQSFIHDAGRLDEALAALHGRHLCMAFGEWRDWCLIDDDEHEKWQVVDTLASLLAREARGDPIAIDIMERLRCTTRKMNTPETEARAPPDQQLQTSDSHLTGQSTASSAVTRCLITLS